MASDEIILYATVSQGEGKSIQYSVIELAEIRGNQKSWRDNKLLWPGLHQNNSKLKQAKWFDTNDNLCLGTLIFIGTKEEAEEQKDLLDPPPEVSFVSVDVATLMDQVQELFSKVTILESEISRLKKVEREFDSVKLAIREKNEGCKFIGQYRQEINYMSMILSTGFKTDLDGFKMLVGDVFGPEFDENKKTARENYENFAERPLLFELMVYFCHCKMMFEKPGFVYGSSFPDYPSYKELGIPNSEVVLDSLNPTSSSPGAPNKRKNVGINIGKSNKKFLTPLGERAKLLCSSYAKTFTNFYHDEKKGEERKEAKRLRERERRAKKKLEMSKAILDSDLEPAKTSEDIDITD